MTNCKNTTPHAPEKSDIHQLFFFNFRLQKCSPPTNLLCLSTFITILIMIVFLYTPDLTVYPYVHDLCFVIFSKFKFHFTCASWPLQCCLSHPIPNTWCFNFINFRWQKHPTPHNSTLFCTYITILILFSLFIHT